jgi:hypothetical protein
MAAVTNSRPEHIEPIDPSEDPVFPELSFTVPAPTEIDWDEVKLSYDRLSDILLLFVADRSQPAVVVYGDDGVWSFLVNPDTPNFVGWQAESFLAVAARIDPDLISLLDHAELIGITPDQLRDERHRALGLPDRTHVTMNQHTTSVRQRSPQRGDAVRSLLTKARLPFEPMVVRTA